MSRRVVFANSTHKATPPAPLDFRHFVVVLFLLNVALVLPVTSQGGGMRNTGRIAPHNENGQEILPEINAFERALSESEKRLRLAQQVARVGTFEWNLKEGVNRWTPELETMYGLSPGSFPGTQPAWEELLHPEDRDEAVRGVERAMKDGAFEGEWRVVWPDGSVHWLMCRAWVFKNQAGEPERLIGVNIDVTDRKRVEFALQESDRRFREMFDVLPVAIYTTDAKGRLTYFNPAAIQFSGRVPDLGTDHWCVSWKLFHSDGTPMRHDECPMALAIREGCIVDGVEAIAERPDGKRVWFAPYPRPLHDAKGRIVGGINMLLDITERKQAEQATGVLAGIVNSSDDAIVSKSLDGIITTWNQGAERMFGYTAEEAIGQHITLIVPHDYRHEESTILERLKRGEQVKHFETVRLRKDGTTLDISLTISPVKDAAGRVVGASKVGRDITERKLAERTGGLLAAIVDSSDDAIISKSLDGVITSWNKSAERLLGYPAEEAIGRHITLIIPRDRRNEEAKILEQIKRGERIEHFETVRLRKDGTSIDISLTISPVRDSAGCVIGASKIARDISEQKRAERALRESEEREKQMTLKAIAAKAKFEAVFEQTSVFAGIMTIDGLFIDANHLYLEACGYRAEEVLGRLFWETAWWRGSQEVQEKIRVATIRAAQGTATREVLPYHCADGTQRIVDFALHPIRDPEGQIIFLHPTGVDITDLKRAEENYRTLAETLDLEVRIRTQELELRNAEVLDQSERLRDLSNRLLRTQDDERRRIARELHDSAGQIITALGIGLANIGQKVRQNPPLAKALEENQELLQQLNKEIRTLSYLLHPPLLDENGLSEAIRWYIQGFTERSGLSIELSVSESFARLPDEMELALFRIVQECLTNIHRHSGCKKATIRILRDAENVRLEIIDDGKGIAAEKLASIQTQRSGVGLTGIRERVRHLRGDMGIKSDTQGTQVSVVLPVR